MSLCVVCHTRKAEVPDRERMGRPVKRVCRECHAERLRGDVERILEWVTALREGLRAKIAEWREYARLTYEGIDDPAYKYPEEWAGLANRAIADADEIEALLASQPPAGQKEGQ